MPSEIQNPGSALGEAIGAQMEAALNTVLQSVAEEHGCHFISKGPFNPKTGRYKKLLLYDDFATSYNVDSVIANESLQPLILIESKYIRYTKHNRDKGSWVCHTHHALRRRYRTIRSSIAVLAGNWSATSQAMMRSHDVNLFLIPFMSICGLLSAHGVVFDWDEKDREAAVAAWEAYQTLTQVERENIGKEMVDIIAASLSDLVSKVLDPQAPRELSRIDLEFHTNLGEVKFISCANRNEAVDVLTTFDFDLVFDDSDGVALSDPPPGE